MPSNKTVVQTMSQQSPIRTLGPVSAFALGSGTEPEGHPAGKPIDLGLGEPTRDPFSGALAWASLGVQGVNHYYPALGLDKLRSLIMERYYPKVGTDDHTVLVTHGAINGLDLIFRAFVTPGDEVLVADTGFPPYLKLAQFARASLKTYSLRGDASGFHFNVRSIIDGLTPRTRVLIVNAPHNPTGACLDERQIRQLRRALDNYPNVLLVSDEVYSEVLIGASQHLTLGGLSDRCLVVNSFSKSLALQGFRVGWILAPNSLGEALVPFFTNAIGAVSSLGQEIALRALSGSTGAASNYRRSVQLVSGILDDYGISYLMPAGGFFILIKVRDDMRACVGLRQLGVTVVPGSGFGHATRGWIRACFAKDDETLVAGFSRLAAGLIKLGEV
jgi:aminotransferase